jgi:hypothetical protein
VKGGKVEPRLKSGVIFAIPIYDQPFINEAKRTHGVRVVPHESFQPSDKVAEAKPVKAEMTPGFVGWTSAKSP